METHPIPAADDQRSNRAWRNWLITYLGVVVIGGFSLLALLVAVDPFASGRFALTQRIDRATTATPLLKAGVLRDPTYNAAILGNSTAQPLDPIRLSAQSGRKFVQLSLPGSAPDAHITLASAFQRHHSEPATLVFVMDDTFWCAREFPKVSRRFFPFPDWLYGSSDLAYVLGLFRPDAFRAALNRLAIWLNLRDQSGRADGYIAPLRRTDRHKVDAELRAAASPTEGDSVDAPFYAMDLFHSFARTLPSSTTLAVVFAPKYVPALPIEGSALAKRVDACKSRAMKIVQERTNALYLDLEIDLPILNTTAYFDHPHHYHDDVADWTADQIANLLKRDPPLKT